MDVSTDGHWSLYKLSVGLIAENLFGFLDNKLDLFLGNGLKGLKVVNDQIQVIVILAHYFNDWLN